MHLHLLGRSPTSTRPAWRWGESPRFPDFAERHDWSAGHERFTADECRAVVERVEERLLSVYGVARSRVAPWHMCPTCAYPTADARSDARCLECESGVAP